MSRGGVRPGAGRPKGSRTIDANLIREAKRQGLEIAGTSLEYLQMVYRGRIKNPDPRRIEAARAACPYEFPRLTDAHITHHTEYDGMTEDQIMGMIMSTLVAPENRDKLIQVIQSTPGLMLSVTDSIRTPDAIPTSP
jgi:hypothetical protein